MQLSGQEDITTRKIRHFAVYKNSKLVFKAEAKPGTLQTVGATGAAAPKHAWINLLSFRAGSENEWGALLRQSKSFDGFLKLLLSNGFDLFSIDKTPAPLQISDGHRFTDGDILVGVAWEHPGQFSTLLEQPETGQLTSKVASMVVYDMQKGHHLAQVFLRAKTYDALLEAIKGSRLKATSI